MDGMQDIPNQIKQYIKKLEQENRELREELMRLKEGFEEYKKRHPQNTGVKNGKPYFFKSTNCSKTPKRPGARIGHKPYFRPMPKHIDEVRRIPVVVCPECGGSRLSKRIQVVCKRTYEDIPVYQPFVIKLEIERRYCRTCKKLLEAPVTWVLPGARLSLRIMLIVVWLKIHFRMTEEAIPQVLKELFGLKICEG